MWSMLILAMLSRHVGTLITLLHHTFLQLCAEQDGCGKTEDTFQMKSSKACSSNGNKAFNDSLI